MAEEIRFATFFCIWEEMRAPEIFADFRAAH
jgi:hypothetical protein